VSTIIIVSLFLGAIQLTSLAFIAEYLGRVFEEVKGRPRYVVARLINFDGDEPPSGVTGSARTAPAD
jgi:dolichol-phosphate mannosyltransferase